jgi:hypothetical protein|tara:strand:+ start:2720 stop:5209 length:2490 start_codon:yes stop_codon:yes gene_type:complete
MAKIKLNGELPKGFKLVDGKIVEDKLMRHGGSTYTTGDQADYGLVTTPQEFYGQTTFNNTRDESVRSSLRAVPRENANVEAEGGETVLTDLSNDGTFGLYNIKGPRHSQGGVPMFLPEQSFIYSDTPKLKFNKEEMSEFNMGGDKKTPAKISKKYDINPFYAELDSQYADNISSRSAELMLQKNMMDLSKLAFMQENKKSFDDGVPLAAHPFLMSVGIDPMEFTSRIEEISIEKAQQNTIDSMPFEQQQQIAMLQQMMAESGQAPQQMQAPPQGSFEEMELSNANNDVIGMAKFGGQGLPKAQDAGEITDYKNPFKVGSEQHNRVEDLRSKGYTFSVVGNKLRAYRPLKSKFDNSEETIREELEGSGSGSTVIYNEDIEGQGKILENSPIGQYRYGRYSKGSRPLRQNKAGDGSYGSSVFMSEEGKGDFYNRWGDVIEQIDGFEYDAGRDSKQWGEFQKLAEKTRKGEAKKLATNAAGVLDKSLYDQLYVPYFKEKGDDGYVKGEGYDSKFGFHTFNAPRLDVDFASDDEQLIELPDEEITGDIPEKVPPVDEFWAQDLNNLSTLGMMEDNLYLPWGPEIERPKIDYVLDDPTQRINANIGAQKTMAQALGMYGPQAIARSNIQGKTMEGNAGAINQVFSNNINTMNRVGATQPQLDFKANVTDANLDMGLYDGTTMALQERDNYNNAYKKQANDLYNVAQTNKANTGNLNDLNDLYKISPDAYGRTYFTNEGREFYQDNRGDQDQNYYNKIQEYTRNAGKQPTPEIENRIYQQTHGGLPNTGMNRGQQQMNQRGIPGGYGSNVQTSQGGGSIKKKPAAFPFYGGKIGI